MAGTNNTKVKEFTSLRAEYLYYLYTNYSNRFIYAIRRGGRYLFGIGDGLELLSLKEILSLLSEQSMTDYSITFKVTINGKTKEITVRELEILNEVSDDTKLIPVIIPSVRNVYSASVTANTKDIFDLSSLVSNIRPELIALWQFTALSNVKDSVKVFSTDKGVIGKATNVGTIISAGVTRMMSECDKFDNIEQLKNSISQSSLDETTKKNLLDLVDKEYPRIREWIKDNSPGATEEDINKAAAIKTCMVINQERGDLLHIFKSDLKTILTSFVKQPESLYTAKGVKYWTGSTPVTESIDVTFNIVGFLVEENSFYYTLFDYLIERLSYCGVNDGEIVEVAKDLYSEIIRRSVMALFILPNYFIQQNKFFAHRTEFYSYFKFSSNSGRFNYSRIYPALYIISYGDDFTINSEGESIQPFGVPLSFSLKGTLTDISYGVIRNFSSSIVNAWLLTSSNTTLSDKKNLSAKIYSNFKKKIYVVLGYTDSKPFGDNLLFNLASSDFYKFGAFPRKRFTGIGTSSFVLLNDKKIQKKPEEYREQSISQGSKQKTFTDTTVLNPYMNK